MAQGYLEWEGRRTHGDAMCKISRIDRLPMVFRTPLRHAELPYYLTLFIRKEEKILFLSFPDSVDNYSRLSETCKHKLYEK